MSTRHPLDTFETALLSELRREVATRAPAPARPRRRRLLATGAATAAAAAAAVGGLALRPDAAFAVEPESDGDVVVTIRSLEDADGLERALAEQGVDAEVEYDADAPDMSGGDTDTHEDPGTAARPELTPGPADGADCLSTIRMERTAEGVTFRLSADAVDSDAVLRITTAGTLDGWSALAVQWEGGAC